MTPTELAFQKIALRCKSDLFYLAKYILGYDLMEEEVHGDLCKYTESLLPSHPEGWTYPQDKTGKDLEDQFSSGNRNLLLLMPRGTFKSSVVTIGFSLQYILNEGNARVLIDSETYGKAKAFLMEIKGHLEANDAYRQVFKAIHGTFPDGENKRKDTLWTDAQLVIASRTRAMKEPTFQVSGVDSPKTGMHYDLIIMDDLHSEKNVTNSEQIGQVIEHWKLAYSLLDPGKPLIIIGTRWHFLDLYQHILDNERRRFNIMVKSAILPDGSLLFPSRLSAEFLEEIRQTQGSSIFSKQYLNNPVSEEDATFKPSNFQRKDWDMVKDRPINWYLMVDPSYEGPYSDFAALVLAGMDYIGDIYVRHVLRKKMTYADIINAMFELNAKFRPTKILLETVGTQKSIMYELNNQQRQRNAWLPVIEIKGRSKSKEERIRGLAPKYEFHHAWHIKECPQLEELEIELMQFPYGQHDDIIDALSTMLEVATPPSPSKSWLNEDRPKRRVLYKPRSPITGV